MQGEDLASLNQGVRLKKGVWIAYPFVAGVMEEGVALVAGLIASKRSRVS